jgi:hypothetical protein
MVVQRLCPQGFDGLCDDLIVGYIRSLRLELQEPSIEIGKYFFFSFSVGQKVFFCIVLRLESLKIEQKFLF